MKRFTICLLILAVIFSLAACHPNDLEAPSSSGTTELTVPSTEAAIPTTEAMVLSPVEGDLYWGMYNGKVFVRSEDANSEPLLARHIKLYTDGTFYSNQSVASANGPVEGTWKWEDGIVYLLWSGTVQQQLTERISQFRYEDGILTFVKGENDISSMHDIPDGTQFIFKGVIKYEGNK